MAGSNEQKPSLGQGVSFSVSFFDFIAVAVSFGTVTINGQAYSYTSVGWGFDAGVAPIDISYDAFVLNRETSIDDFSGKGYVAYVYTGVGTGVLMNGDGKPIGVLGGVKTNFDYGGLRTHTFTTKYTAPPASLMEAEGYPLGAKCFPAGTLIDVSADCSIRNSGARRFIETLQPGDMVASFGGVGVDSDFELKPIARVFRGLTTEWLVLRRPTLRSSEIATVTPGHRFLNEFGRFEAIDSIVRRGGSIVTRDGELIPAVAERIAYSEATRHLYEEAEEIVYASSGGNALAPQIRRGWRTYNFEVADYHTYIANGIRVHNDSVDAFASYLVQMQPVGRMSAASSANFLSQPLLLRHGPRYTGLADDAALIRLTMSFSGARLQA